MCAMERPLNLDVVRGTVQKKMLTENEACKISEPVFGESECVLIVGVPAARITK